MNLLEIIGLCAIGVVVALAFKYYYRNQNEAKAKFVEKATILINNHPELSATFREYLKKENEGISGSYNQKYDEYNYDDGYRGKQKEIFGRKYNIYYSHINIEKIISDRINDLEKDINEKEIIRKVIEQTKVKYLNIKKTYEITLYENSAKFLKYGETLKSIFPDSNVKLNKEVIVEMLAYNLQISNSDAEIAFIRLTQQPAILLEYTEKLLGPKTGKYWYSEPNAIGQIKRAQKSIDYHTFKYH